MLYRSMICIFILLSHVSVLTEKVKQNKERHVQVLKRLEDEARKNSFRSIGPVKGRILSEIINRHKPTRILEVGTLYGYSAILMASLLPKDLGKLVTIEINTSAAHTARKNFAEAELSDKIQIIVGNALEVIPKLRPKMPFELLFLDARKNQYLRYLLLVEQYSLLDSCAGVVVADNVGAYEQDMLNYLEYVRMQGKYSSKTIMTKLEFTDNVHDAIEVSIKVA